MSYINLDQTINNRKKQPKKRNLFIPGCLLILGFITVSLVIARQFGFASLMTPFSVFSQMVGNKLEQTDGRTNILILGIDKKLSMPRSSLTDTILVVSISKREKNAVIISIPRDLWINFNNLYRGKINSAYSVGGMELTHKLASNILDLPLHYYGLIDFDGFKQAIDLLDGLDIEVEREFDDYVFPRPGYENALPESERWQHIHFDKGLQHMDGERALQYARSRHALGPEGSDFARARRQQKVLLALKARVLSAENLINPTKITELFSTFKKSVETNIGVWEAQRFYDLVKDIKQEDFKTIVINGGQAGEPQFLYHPEETEPYDGVWVLVPKAGDFSEIHRYVQRLLFGEY